MNNNKKIQLDRYSMMIVSKYFSSIKSFIKLIQICKKFKEIPEMYHYNPVKLMMKTNLFPNIETYHIYDKKEKKIEGYDNYVYWYQVHYEKYLNKNENEQFKNVRFSLYDWKKYKSFKGATTLGSKSFLRCNLEEIDLNGITKIESYCFGANTIVKQIKLDKRISTIPDDCFDNCTSLQELDLSYIKIFGNNCFNECNSLTSLTLPEMLFEIGKNCFNGLSELEKIETKGMKVIEANMNYSLYKSFKRNGIDVKGNISFCLSDRIKYGEEIPKVISIIGQNCFNGVMVRRDFELPKSVTKLDYYCFNHCPIISIDLSHVIKNKCDFNGCDSLTSITLNKNIVISSENQNKLFYNYFGRLKNIELSDTNYIPIVSNNLRILMDKKGYQYNKCIYTKDDRIKTYSIIPDEVNIIDESVFNYVHVKTITIPSNVSYIDFDNFFCMTDLESIEIQSTNIQCDGKCFFGLQRIKELDLRAITSFGKYCIYDCPSLTKLTIQNTHLENGLINCDSLKEIEIMGIENNEYEHPIDYKMAKLLENKGIHCKRKVFFIYESSNNEKTYCIPNGVNEIDSKAFYYLQLKEITIPSSVVLIKSLAFGYCYKLTHLIIEGNPIIEKKAVNCCNQLIQKQPELKQYS